MSSDPTSDEEQPEVDDETLPKVFQEPIRTAGDLSEAADAAPGITKEDVARDLEAVAKAGVPSERELLLQILWRLGRIEQQLEKGASQVPQPERRSSEDMLSELMNRMGRIERSRDGLSERIHRIELDVDRPRGSGSVDSQPIGSRSKQRPPSEESHIHGPIKPQSAEGPTASKPGPVSSGQRLVKVRSLVDKLIERPAGQTSQRLPQFPRKRPTDQPKDSSAPED
jgi:hypothetical protein